MLEPLLLAGPNIPLPLHGVAPRVVLGQKWWDRERRAAYRATGFHCLACGVHKSEAKFHRWLEGHEVYRIVYLSGVMTYERTVPLCHACHSYVHDGRLEYLKKSRMITFTKYAAVIQHGEAVLAAAGHSRLPRVERDREMTELLMSGRVAPSKSWRLVIPGHGTYSAQDALEKTDEVS